ncbi:DNA repair protein complementing XP-C cells homolog [Aricia agestis]|uniref:DNA repair protein complementing XP-C cells homolog n=1 Tax=Aricia agestis TaxID=91739 RepID=UPI001C20C0D7|nr:DNA repair protein complementing XP-C cells homolog [Aricia agestis]
MPTTRKKVIKTVYKDEDDSAEGGDFSDSGSEAEITPPSSSDEDISDNNHSEDDFKKSHPRQRQQKSSKASKPRKVNFTKSFLGKINKQSHSQEDEEQEEETPFSVKDLTEADKLLPSVLNLSESDSSDDESIPAPRKKAPVVASTSKILEPTSDSENIIITEYQDVWSHNKEDNSEEVARKTYLELEMHNNKIEETKKSIRNYVIKTDSAKESNIKDLLALGEEELLDKSGYSAQDVNDDSDAEMEDWEEVKESKGIPTQGLQLIVNIPDELCRKRKKVDVEMMLKRKANRHTKEAQVFKHKVHVLCWLGHGNYISQVINDQEILAAVLSLLPSKQCYPGDQVDMKYVEHITTWFKDKVTLKQDKNENKYKPKAPPLKTLLLQQIKSKVFSTKKYIVFAFVAMLRSLGLKCRVMLNFVTVPLRPPASDLLSLSTKPTSESDKPKEKDESSKTQTKKQPQVKSKDKKSLNKKPITKAKIPQLDGVYDSCSSDSEMDNIVQLDGNNDTMTVRTRKAKNENTKSIADQENKVSDNDASPPKKPRRQTRSQAPTAKAAVNAPDPEVTKTRKGNQKIESKDKTTNKRNVTTTRKSLSLKKDVRSDEKNESETCAVESQPKAKGKRTSNVLAKSTAKLEKRSENSKPKIVISSVENKTVSSEFFEKDEENIVKNRKRSRTTEPISDKVETKPRTRSAQQDKNNTSKYFQNDDLKKSKVKSPAKKIKVEEDDDDSKRVSHKDLSKTKEKPKSDVSEDLKHIIKGRIKEEKTKASLKVVKGKVKKESDDDSDYLPVESPKRKPSGSDDDFKVKKTTPKPKGSATKKKDRRVLSTDDELPINKVDVWAEVFVEELEEWIAVDVIEGKVHCVSDIYRRATHPVAYVVGWDNNNHIKDLTKRYVPHWNTVTRKQRVQPSWWDTAVKPWLGPKTARDREEDERLERMQLEAPLPKAISEYKNHPLYALARHLLKFEAIYPPDAATLGFVRGEAVYARNCVYVCRSRDTWLKEAKVVRLGEKPYKVVKARPKWDRLSNKLITDKPLEVFGPWQVQDYEPPTAENGIVPRNAYGNVELFKDCMLPKGTVHIKLPGLNRVAKKLNIDCAPAMTGFDFNGGWSHPVYDGFVVCKEFEEIITEAWAKDQEDQERREIEKFEARVYGNWKRLIKGMLIKERLKAKYGFEEPGTSKDTKGKGPKLVVKKK